MQAKNISRAFVESYHRWQDSLYEGKYHYLGDAELMNTAFLLDLACYFAGPVRLVHNLLEEEMSRFPYQDPVGERVAKFMRFYNRRLVSLAKRRYASGCYGRRNLDWRYLVKGGFAPDASVLHKLRAGIWHWLKAEAHGCKLPRATMTEPASENAPALQEM